MSIKIKKLLKNANLPLDKTYANVLVFALLLVFLPVAVFLATNEVNLRREAAPSSYLELKPRVYLESTANWKPVPQVGSNWIVPPNTDFLVDIVLHTGSAVETEGYFFILEYVPTEVTVGSVSNINCGEAFISTTTGAVSVNQVSLLKYNLAKEVSRDASNNEIGQVGGFCLAGPAPISPLDVVQAVPPNSQVNVGYVIFHSLSSATDRSISFKVDPVDPLSGPTQIYEYGYFSNTNPIDSVEPDAPCDGDPNTPKRDCENILISSSLQPMVFDIGAIPTPTIDPNQPSIDLSTPSTSVMQDEAFDVEIRVDSMDQSVVGVDAIIDYDTMKFDVIAVTPNSTSSLSRFEKNSDVGYNGGYYYDTIGRIDISALIGEPVGQTANGVVLNNELLATVTFQATASTGTPTSPNITVFIDPNEPNNDSNIALEGTGTDILGSHTNLTITVDAPIPPTATPAIPTPTVGPNTPTPQPTATPTPTITPTPNPQTISIKINLEGRNWKTGLLNRLITVDIFQNDSVVDNIPDNVSNATTGLFSFIPAVSLGIGTSYDFVIQPKGYLNQTVSHMVTSTVNDLDLSGTLFKSGDLDNSGKVTGTDYNIMLSFLKQRTSGSSVGNDSLETSDLDGSGQVNSLDFSLMVSHWNECGAYEDTDLDGTFDTKFDPVTNPCN